MVGKQIYHVKHMYEVGSDWPDPITARCEVLMSGWRVFFGAAVIAAVVAVALVLWVDRVRPVSITIVPAPTEMMHVSIAGAVASPGVVAVPPGARLVEAADAAGGFTPDADFSRLNLAGRVGDGEHIAVPSTAQVADTGEIETSGGTSQDAQGPLDVNTATAEQLDELPGIGEVLAGRIIEYREVNGAFGSIDDLVLVEGISLRMVDDLRPLITVGPDG